MRSRDKTTKPLAPQDLEREDRHGSYGFSAEDLKPAIKLAVVVATTSRP